MRILGRRPNTDYSNLFGWWIASITFNILFVVFASIFLYSKRKTSTTSPMHGRARKWATDFFFVWILLALLVLYIVSISERSEGYFLFAGGNLVVELVLTFYVIREGRPSKQSVS